MKKLIYIFLAFVLAYSCGTPAAQVKRKPEWVVNRPVNEAYYVGIGIASKTGAPNEYQQIAKKNALNDLISEIRVTVSTNSVLSQYQNNSEFKQQFESETKISALNSIEGFQVVDSWEDKESFWIYYRLSKLDFAENRRKKMLAAIERAQDFMQRSDQLDIRKSYMQSLRTKVKAIAVLQEFLNEDVQTVYNGKNVYLVNELLSNIQDQLYKVSIKSMSSSLNGKVGKPITNPFDVYAYLEDSISGKTAVPFMPMKMSVEQGQMDFGAQTETDHKGIASFSVARVLAKDPIQLIRISTDIGKIIRVDSLSQSLQNILLSLDVPSTSIRVNVEPIKMFMSSVEKNLSQELPMSYIEPILKKSLVDAGCNFVKTPAEADYVLHINANSKPLGIIWGNMQQAALDMSISLVDAKNDAEIFKDAMQNVKGFQTTPENAGLDAYKAASDLLMKNIYPKLKDELLKREK